MMMGIAGKQLMLDIPPLPAPTPRIFPVDVPAQNSSLPSASSKKS